MAHRPVDLVEVNHIGLQPLQAVVAGLRDVRCSQVCAALAYPGHAPGGTSHFGGQHQLGSGRRIFGQPAADDGFGRAIGFDPGGH